MRRILKKTYNIFSRFTIGFFYDKKYLCGRWFDSSTKGYRWCWRSFFMQKIIGYNRQVPWPVSHRNNVGDPSHIIFDPDDLNNFQNFGCYYQAFDGYIRIGKGTYIAPNVGLITQNHNLENLNAHEMAKDIDLGKHCWIGMNTMILPGVRLGDHTVVGAGSVVTKSFEEGNCVIAGNPAKIIRKIDA